MRVEAGRIESPRENTPRFPVFERGFPPLKKGRFQTASFPGSLGLWMSQTQTLGAITDRSFEGVLPDTSLSSIRGVLAGIAAHQDSLVTTLIDRDSGTSVGFTTARPARVPHSPTDAVMMGPLATEFQHYAAEGMTFDEYCALQRGTTEVGVTAILPEFRGMGGLPLLLTDLERRMAQLKREGKYDSVITGVRTADDFAATVKRFAAGEGHTLAYEAPYDSPTMGPQEFLRYNL